MNFHDTRETRDPEARERELLSRLPAQIAHARAAAPAFGRLLADVDPDSVTSREALATLPVTRKSELLELQKAARPFGGFSAVGWGAACRRVFASPGPLYEPEGARPDYYRLARALFAAGFRAGDLVHNTFSYHFTPAGSMMETAAHALGSPAVHCPSPQEGARPQRRALGYARSWQRSARGRPTKRIDSEPSLSGSTFTTSQPREGSVT